MSGETGVATLGETIYRIANAAGRAPGDITGLVVSDQLPRLDSQEHMEALRRFVLNDELETLILDPAYLCLNPDGNESSLFAMGAMLRSIGELCGELGTTLILAHHTRKSAADPYKPPELDDIAFAGFGEFCRQWILVGRREKYEPGSGFHRLWINCGGSAGHSALWAADIAEGVYDGHTPRQWNVDLARAEDARQDARSREEEERAENRKRADEARLEAAKRKLLEAAAKFPNGETKNVLKDAAGLSGTLANRALAELIRDRSLEVCDVKKGNRLTPVEGYRLLLETAD